MKKYIYALITSLAVYIVSSICLAAVVIAFAIDSVQVYNNDLILIFMVFAEIFSAAGLVASVVFSVLLEKGNKKTAQNKQGESEQKE